MGPNARWGWEFGNAGGNYWREPAAFIAVADRALKCEEEKRRSGSRHCVGRNGRTAPSGDSG